MELGLTQDEAAEAIGIDVRTYRRYESGKVNEGRGLVINRSSQRRILSNMTREFGIAESDLLCTVQPNDLSSTASKAVNQGFSITRKQVPDFLISYDHIDLPWAKWIAWRVGGAGYSTVVKEWNFRSGGNFVLTMQKNATEAECIIVLLSQDYLDARFTLAEWAAAFAQDPTGIQGKLLAVRVRSCDLGGLLPALIYLDLVGKGEEPARRSLISAVKKQGQARRLGGMRQDDASVLSQSESVRLGGDEAQDYRRLLDYKFVDIVRIDFLLRQLSRDAPSTDVHDKVEVLQQLLLSCGRLSNERPGRADLDAVSPIPFRIESMLAVRASFSSPTLASLTGLSQLSVWICPPYVGETAPPFPECWPPVPDLPSYSHPKSFLYLLEAHSNSSDHGERPLGTISGASALLILMSELIREAFGAVDPSLAQKLLTLGQLMSCRAPSTDFESASDILRWAAGSPLRALAVMGARLSQPTNIRALYRMRSISRDLYFRSDDGALPPIELKPTIDMLPRLPKEHSPPTGQYIDVLAYPLFVAEEL